MPTAPATADPRSQEKSTEPSDQYSSIRHFLLTLSRSKQPDFTPSKQSAVLHQWGQCARLQHHRQL